MRIDAIILAAVTIIITVAVAVLFAKRKPASACAVVFCGIVVLVMIFCVSFVNPLDHGRYSKDFSRKVAEIVPQSEKLVAYRYVSERFVHYFGRIVPVIGDKSLLYKHYEDGEWVIATAEPLKDLAQQGRLRRVYYREKAEHRKQKDTSGALFHKSAEP